MNLDLTKLREIAESGIAAGADEAGTYYGPLAAALDPLPVTVLALIDEIERLRGADERAWWWDEAGEDYVFSAGEPYRRERVDGVLETKEALVRSCIRVRGYAKVFRFFRDTRWQPEPEPEPEPLKVGDVIETVEDAERFTAYEYGKAAVIDRDGDIWTTAGRGRLALEANRDAVVGVLRVYGPLTVIHVPAVDK